MLRECRYHLGIIKYLKVWNGILYRIPKAKGSQRMATMYPRGNDCLDQDDVGQQRPTLSTDLKRLGTADTAKISHTSNWIRGIHAFLLCGYVSSPKKQCTDLLFKGVTVWDLPRPTWVRVGAAN
ncbi:predicted protein [Pyrenophora tritici-repentis Pt-1C-BFP]|uniref:Uncharacterized protein n=1 Tax=Pyrenophora tritici-repentis (strain Pt-1C-BFP) TaxID=426418 RepID=B2WFZ3_PYRTR|nr:uncharacterized protein PTRG_08849 [Pyrenophora tritici-repentis Pt-1C-BFP]EDU41900.1 predicted protein [Pyrenophora tritici-repentis Pt-1C-BFP]